MACGKGKFGLSGAGGDDKVEEECDEAGVVSHDETSTKSGVTDRMMADLESLIYLRLVIDFESMNPQSTPLKKRSVKEKPKNRK